MELNYSDTTIGVKPSPLNGFSNSISFLVCDSEDERLYYNYAKYWAHAQCPAKYKIMAISNDLLLHHVRFYTLSAVHRLQALTHENMRRSVKSRPLHCSAIVCPLLPCA